MSATQSKKHPGGRPKGSKDSRPRLTMARKIAEQAAEEGITPLDVFKRSFRADWSKYEALAAEAESLPQSEERRALLADALSARAMAVAVAEKAAPYMHSRLAAMTVKDERPPVEIDCSDLSNEELEQAMKILQRVVK